MADGKIKISELEEALQISDNAQIPYSQENGGVQTTFKGPVSQIARKIAEGITYTNLETTAKTLVGAINELSHLGNPILLGTTAPTSSQGANGNLYVQYTEGTGGAPDTVDSIYAKIDGAWCEIETGGGGGSGGHTIVDDSGTALTQRTNLQFKGAYSDDNSTDDTTEVNVVREMTQAAFDQLTEAEKQGLIRITDGALNVFDKFQPLIFSIDEREIGVWTDGKPLYEKTFTSTTIVGFNSSTLMVLDGTIPSGIEIVKTVGSIDLTLSNAHYSSSSSNWFSWYVNYDDNNIYASQSLASATPVSCVTAFTLRYTKTTDTPGSGQWTPQGVPSHHYLTDEQVIGTWIDGSTLYEKTVVGDDTYNEQFNYIPHGVTNLDKIIDYFGYCIYAGNEFSLIPYLRGTTYMTVTTWDSTNIRVERTGLSSSFTGVRLVIRYTKSST